jgi:toxin-antitoxin system PIN domain toxin
MIVDANILLFAVDRSSPFHRGATAWLTDALNGPRRVGMPWQSLGAFLRIATNPRALERPLEPGAAFSFVRDWLSRPSVWTPAPTDRHADVLESLIERYQVRGNLVTDAELAALAIEHGLAVCSADTDFGRFQEVRWINPIAPA